MQKVSIEISKEEIKKALLQFEPSEIKNLLEELRDKKEVWSAMKISESSLDFWNSPEEDIYSDEL